MLAQHCWATCTAVMPSICSSRQSMHVTTQQAVHRPCAPPRVRFLKDMLFCRRIHDSGSDVQYYLLVDLHEDAEDLEHGTSFDIQVTDGQSAWSQKGGQYRISPVFCLLALLRELASPSLPPVYTGLHRPTTQIADWMSTAKQALSEESDRFTFIITPKKKPGILRV